MLIKFVSFIAVSQKDPEKKTHHSELARYARLIKASKSKSKGVCVVLCVFVTMPQLCTTHVHYRITDWHYAPQIHQIWHSARPTEVALAYASAQKTRNASAVFTLAFMLAAAAGGHMPAFHSGHHSPE